MKAFDVAVTWPEPIVHLEIVPVQAFTHSGASNAARELRDWPAGCTFTPRAVDRSEYEPRFVDTVSGRLLVRAPRLVVNNLGRRDV